MALNVSGENAGRLVLQAQKASLPVVGEDTEEGGYRIIGLQPSEARRAAPGSARVFSG